MEHHVWQNGRDHESLLDAWNCCTREAVWTFKACRMPSSFALSPSILEPMPLNLEFMPSILESMLSNFWSCGFQHFQCFVSKAAARLHLAQPNDGAWTSRQLPCLHPLEWLWYRRAGAAAGRTFQAPRLQGQIRRGLLLQAAGHVLDRNFFHEKKVEEATHAI